MEEKGDLISNFEKGMIVGAKLTGSSNETVANLVDCSPAIVSRQFSLWKSQTTDSSIGKRKNINIVNQSKLKKYRAFCSRDDFDPKPRIPSRKKAFQNAGKNQQKKLQSKRCMNDFEVGVIIGARSSGASVMKTMHLVNRSASSVCSTYNTWLNGIRQLELIKDRMDKIAVAVNLELCLEDESDEGAKSENAAAGEEVNVEMQCSSEEDQVRPVASSEETHKIEPLEYEGEMAKEPSNSAEADEGTKGKVGNFIDCDVMSIDDEEN